MKHLRITVEGKVYEVAVEIVGTESGASAADTIGRARAAGAVRSGKVSAPPASAASSARPAAVPAPAPAKASAAVATADAAAVCSPLTALVVSIDVSVGQQVSAGDRLVTLEAMKMNTIVNAAKSGTVSAIHVAAADAVEEGQPLVSVE